MILTVCLVNRDRFSVDGVLHYSPRNPLTAVLFMLFLFALKSLSVFIFSGILFAASGILFPLPAAIAVSPLFAVAEPVPADEEYADQHLDHDGGPEPGGGGFGDVHAHDGEGDEGEGHPQKAPGQVG